jgi:DNA-binding beta-propeller fold protein YncE
MRTLLLAIAGGLFVFGISLASNKTHADPYSVLKSTKVGGAGGFDYVYADSAGRKLYIARSGQGARVTAFDLDTLAPAGQIDQTNAHGVAADTASHHAFASSKPVAMWDTETMKLIKTIDVDGRPDGIMADPFNHHIYVFSHSAPNATVIDANDGKVLGTIDLGGAPEQAATDGAGHIFVDLEDKDAVAEVDANTMKVTHTYSLNGKGGGNAGLAFDAKNHVLFVACREPSVMVMMDATNGNILATLPTGNGCDGAVFNPDTMECFSSQGDGTLTVIKENSPTSFEVEQTVKTMQGAKTCTLDSKTGHILLIAAEYVAPDPSATPPAGGRRRRQMKPDSFTIVTVGK